MNIRKLAPVLVFVLIGVYAFAEGTRTWLQDGYDSFEKGTATGVAIRSNGTLELAPAFRSIATTPSTYIWSIAAEKSGNIFLGAGSPGRVYAVLPDGKMVTIFEPQELQVQTLVVNGKGVIYAATSPDGKVYKIERLGQDAKRQSPATGQADKAKPGADSGWTSSLFFEPKTKYIWALALDSEDRLYIATGDHGEIYRVDRNGTGTLFFKSDEAHIRALAFDPEGNLIAGSDGSGLVYRISPQGEAFVLYSAPKKEITALAVDQAGNIYAAGAGEKRAPASSLSGVGGSVPLSPGNIAGAGTPPSGSVPLGSASGLTQLPPNFPLSGLSATGSEVYRIAPDGSPARIWDSREDLVYALAFNRQGRLAAGTGNKGRILSIQGERQFADLLKASATQVTGFAPAPNGGLYVATSNLGKVFLLGDEPQTEGTYQSDVFDARTFSRWGRAEVRGTGTFELWARSGNVDNPDRNWSPWTQVDLRKDDPLAVPAARFVQWKAVLHPGPPSAEIDSVRLNYLPKNVGPVMDEVAVQPGARFQSVPKFLGSENVTVSFGSQPSPSSRAESAPPAVRDHDSIAVRWTAHDDNDDQLVYSIHYRGDSETKWKLLKDKIIDKFYSFDAGLLPDGGYTVKVVASDTPSNSPDSALSDERESQHFEVDTTSPRIDDLNVVAENGELHVTFRATDNFSVIKRAEYSIDAGEWQFIEPVGRISDARTENYDFAVPEPGAKTPVNITPAPKARGSKNKAPADPVALAPAAEHLVVVRAWDRFENMATAKTVIHTK